MVFPIHINIVDLVFKGMLIGMIASAPMGPVGILCVQRTLNKGRGYGFATGLGAAVSDIIYAGITGFGMAFVMDFINNEQNKFYLQIIGSVLLLAFGVGLFIFFIYKKTYAGVMYSSSFGVTLVALTMITTLVILAVTSNVVLSLGMVGALSIVRSVRQSRSRWISRSCSGQSRPASCWQPGSFRWLCSAVSLSGSSF